MAELLTEGVVLNKSAENGGDMSAVEGGASVASATDGQDRSLESAKEATMNSGSLSASPVDSLEAGFYKV